MRLALAVALLIALVACAPLPERVGSPAQWRPSSNFDERRPNFVIIHDTTNDTAERALRTLTDPLREVSAHYLIGRDGALYQLVDERARAWHAGVSQWGATTDLNSSSIGIELDNNGDEPLAEPQIAALLKLLAEINGRYHIPAANFIGHADVAPRRKVDPSGYFPWKRLAAQGFGLWCDPPWPAPQQPVDVPLALKAIGYDVSSLAAAIQAFKLHFAADDLTSDLTSDNVNLLHCLAVKSMNHES